MRLTGRVRVWAVRVYKDKESMLIQSEGGGGRESRRSGACI